MVSRTAVAAAAARTADGATRRRPARRRLARLEDRDRSPALVGVADRRRRDALPPAASSSAPICSTIREILPEAMERLQRARDGAARSTAHRAALERPFHGAWAGAADGDVVLVEFFDYACGYLPRLQSRRRAAAARGSAAQGGLARISGARAGQRAGGDRQPRRGARRAASASSTTACSPPAGRPSRRSSPRPRGEPASPRRPARPTSAAPSSQRNYRARPRDRRHRHADLRRRRPRPPGRGRLRGAQGGDRRGARADGSGRGQSLRRRSRQSPSSVPV